MKHATRLLALALALTLLCGVALADMGDNVYLDDTFPIVKEPVHVDVAFAPAWMFVTSEYDEDTFWEIRYLREKTNLDLSFTVIDPSTQNETINLMLAGGELPDLVLGAGLTTGDIVNYGTSQGVLRKVDDLIDFMPTYKKILEENPSIRAGVTAPDGHMYSFPTLSYGDYAFSYRPWINQEWLENVGLENPTTVEELYDVLLAFKQQDANGNGDPNDEIPWSGGWEHTYSALSVMNQAYGFIGGYLSFDYSDGKDGSTIVYAPTTDAYKELLSFLNRCWTEGLLDPDYFTQTEIQAYAKALADTVGLFGATSPDATGFTDNINDRTWVAMNALVDDAGETPVVPGYAPIRDISRAFISAKVDDDKAAAIANLIDYYYTDLAFINNWYGPELGSEDDYFGNGKYFNESASDLKFKDRESDFWWNVAISKFVFWEVPGTTNVGNKFIEKRWAEAHPDSLVAQFLKGNGSYAYWQQDLIDRALKYEVSRIPAMFMSEDDTEQLGLLQTQLDNYAKSCASKFVVGEMSLESDWEEFQNTLATYGVEQYIEIYNGYYDEYKANMK